MCHATTSPAAPRRPYVPRDPQQSVLVQLLAEHLDAFIEANQADDPDWRVPAFVERELRSIVECGDFTKGFVLLRCEKCSAARVVPFSCKSRLCPSCAGRRMSDLAAHLVDRVLSSAIPYRQFVLTLPWTLRRHAAFDARLANAITSIASDVLLEWLRACAREDGVPDGQPTGVVHLQRHGDAGTLNFHAHFVLAEGVYVALSPEDVRFHRTRAPRDEDVQALVCEIERRVTRWLARHESDGAAARPEAAPVLLHLSAAPSVECSEPAEQPRADAPRRRKRSTPLCASSPEGFNLHAAVRVDAGSKSALERLLRYVARPPIPQDRLEWLEDGRIAFNLKRTWARGIRRFAFEPFALIARLAALVAPPNFPMLRYLGAVAPHARIRPHVIPEPPEDETLCLVPFSPARPKHLAWADLLARVWAVDARTCRCGGRFRLVAAITQPDVVQAVLAALILSGRHEPFRKGRAPPD